MKLTLKELPVIEPLLPTFVKIDHWVPNTMIPWIYEPKFDGVRCLLYWTRTDGVRLVSRTERNITNIPKVFKNQLHDSFMALGKFDNLIFDGELITIDPKHVLGNFESFQRRTNKAIPLIFQYRVFDLIYTNQQDLRTYILSVRRKLLEKNFPINTLQFKFTPSSTDRTKLPAYVNQEELVAKNLQSRYIGGRQTSWMKLKTRDPQKFYVIGFNEGFASQYNTFGSLKIANEKLEYVGDLSNGITDQDRELIWSWIIRHCKDRWRAFSVEIYYSRYNTSGQLHQPFFDKAIFPGE